MYTIEFYENENGESQVWNFLEKLRKNAKSNKNERVQYKQISFYIELLQKKWHPFEREYHKIFRRWDLGTPPRE